MSLHDFLRFAKDLQERSGMDEAIFIQKLLDYLEAQQEALH